LKTNFEIQYFQYRVETLIVQKYHLKVVRPTSTKTTKLATFRLFKALLNHEQLQQIRATELAR